jgi:hypothetical protein
MKSAYSRRISGLAVWAIAITSTTGLVSAQQQVHHNSFEQKTGWVRGGSDAAFDETLHNIGDEAYDGLRSEHLQFVVRSGKSDSYIHYQYAIGQAVISDEFSARIWIKANRPGIRLYARLILPNEQDKQFIERKLSTLLPGEVYDKTGHWQQLTIPRPQMLLRKAKEALQSKDQLGRAVNFDGAYVDALVLNVYAGLGNSEVWIDALEVGPISGPVPAPIVEPKGPAPQNVTDGPQRASPRQVANPYVKFNGTQLQVGDRNYFMRGIRHTDTPLRVLHDAGFNTVFLDSPQPRLVREAMDLGFWLVPQLHVLGNDPRFVSTDNLAQEVNRFTDNDAVLFWNLGNKLTRQHSENIGRAMQTIQNMDGGRCFGGDVADGSQHYSRHSNFLVGAHRFPLGTSLEMLSYRDWLDQHRRPPIAHPGAYTWTWIQTHMPDETTQVLYDRSGHDGFNEAVGPQPEQIRLLTYTALAAGYKGIGFWSDRWLADSHHGRDRLLSCAMLNQELDMLEPILMNMDEPPQWIETSVTEVKAAILRTAKGALVLPIWLGKGSQYVPGQAAVGKLTMTVPHIPQTMQAWDIHPADVHGIHCDRVVGGTKIELKEFSLTSAILFSADKNLIQRLQEQSQSRRQLAAQWSYDLALYELIKVRKIHDQLAAVGQTPTKSNYLLAEAEKSLRSAQELWDNRNFSESYHESQRAMRPVRILMRMEWDRAVKQLDAPVASPYAVSYYSLPRHWQFMEQKEQFAATTNALPGGEFEIIKERPQETWHSEETVNDDVEVSATRVSDVVKIVDVKGTKGVEAPHGGRQCAMLQIKAVAKHPTPSVLENTRISLVSPTVKLQPGTWVQVSAWIYMSENVQGSPDGAMFYDSVGGEALAVRLTEPIKKEVKDGPGTRWKKYTLYRRIPASGSIYVTLALTGIGSVYFDDVTIEPLVPSANPALNPVRFGGAITP